MSFVSEPVNLARRPVRSLVGDVEGAFGVETNAFGLGVDALFEAFEVEDFAADNASYKRRDLDRVKDAMSNGFWETFVHKEMRRAGMSLLKSPEITVYHQRSFTFSAFMNQRFLHGRQFGETRAADMSAFRRLAFVLLSPLIPFIYLFRITRRVLSKNRNTVRFLMSFPILVLFLLSWSAGEFTGYLWSSEK